MIIQRIDKKYLVIETLDEPEFYEGNLVYTAMYDINKSMIEHINQYERGQQDFKDFIEMWVHEIKLSNSKPYAYATMTKSI